MKILSVCCIACLALIMSCQKKVNDQTTGNDRETRKKIAPDYFKLPANGQFVDITLSNGKKMTLYKVDTMYLIEGDIALTPTQVELLKATGTGNARAFITSGIRHWQGGVVPYEMSSNLSSSSQNDILFAMYEWESAVPGLDFVPKTSAHRDYIHFTAVTGPNESSRSPIGKIGGGQIIYLVQDDIWGVGFTVAEHEIGHSLGLFHEQSRTDRDNFILINWSNIRPEKYRNFETFDQLGYPGANLGTFDFSSVMLYSSITNDPNFVYDVNVPVMTLLDGVTTWDGNWWISAGDAETASFIYGPPYARVRYEFTDQSQWDETYRTVDIFMDFFADEALTIPTAFDVSKQVTIKRYVEQFYQNNWHYSTGEFTLNIPTNVTSLQLADDMTVEHIVYDFGNIYSGYRESNLYYSGFIRQTDYIYY